MHCTAERVELLAQYRAVHRCVVGEQDAHRRAAAGGRLGRAIDRHDRRRAAARRHECRAQRAECIARHADHAADAAGLERAVRRREHDRRAAGEPIERVAGPLVGIAEQHDRARAHAARGRYLRRTRVDAHVESPRGQMRQRELPPFRLTRDQQQRACVARDGRGDRLDVEAKRQPHREAAAGARRARHRDPAAHRGDEAIAQREPEARAAVTARDRRVDLRERTEQLVQIRAADADARILDRDRQLRRAAFAAHRAQARGHVSVRGELDRVAEQIAEHLREPRRIAAHALRRARRDLAEQRQPLRLRDGRVRAQLARDHADRIEFDRLDRHRAGLDLREIENAADELEQPRRRVAQRLHAAALRQIEHRALEQFEIAEDHVQRRADLVAHRGEERRLRRIRGVRRAHRFFELLHQLPLRGHVDDRDDQHVAPLIARIACDHFQMQRRRIGAGRGLRIGQHEFDLKRRIRCAGAILREDLRGQRAAIAAESRDTFGEHGTDEHEAPVGARDEPEPDRRHLDHAAAQRLAVEHAL
ncbi:hypothetical protein FEP50_05343 [Burkholderia multivorans]|nr:hypothetical protein [Burkholderia multivorans]